MPRLDGVPFQTISLMAQLHSSGLHLISFDVLLRGYQIIPHHNVAHRSVNKWVGPSCGNCEVGDCGTNCECVPYAEVRTPSVWQWVRIEVLEGDSRHDGIKNSITFSFPRWVMNYCLYCICDFQYWKMEKLNSCLISIIELNSVITLWKRLNTLCRYKRALI
jgi:hypothetical protein